MKKTTCEQSTCSDSGPLLIISIVVVVILTSVAAALIVYILLLRKKNANLSEHLRQAEERNEQLLGMTDRLQPTGSSTASLDNYQEPTDTLRASRAPEDPYSMPDTKITSKASPGQAKNRSKAEQGTKLSSKSVVSMSQVEKAEDQATYSVPGPNTSNKQVEQGAIQTNGEEDAYASAMPVEHGGGGKQVKVEQEQPSSKSLDVYSQPVKKSSRASPDLTPKKSCSLEALQEEEDAEEPAPTVPAKLYDEQT